MLVMLQASAPQEETRAVCRKIEELGYRAHPIPGATRTAIGITGNTGPVDASALEALAGVGECIPVSKPYKLAGRELKEEDTVVDLGDGVGRGRAGRELKEEDTVVDLGDGVRIGGPELAIIAGPCAIESREQAFAIAAAVRAAGARLFRGGAYKPRTSPYSFQGLGEKGLEILSDVRAEFGLKIVTEAVDNESLERVEGHAGPTQSPARES